MRQATTIFFAVILTMLTTGANAQNIAGREEDRNYPFAAYLDGKAPQILRELPSTEKPPEGVQSRRVVFRLRDGAEIMAIVAAPIAPGPHPGILLLHGGHGYAQESKAYTWAKLGYVAVAPDLPGFADRSKITESKGPWKKSVNEKGVYVAVPDSGLLDVVPAALKALDLLRAQPNVDAKHVGVWGISLGGYTTTMVCGLVGDRVQAGYSLYGCGFYELNSQLKHLKPMPDDEREAWLKYLDAGRRAPGIKVPFFIAGVTNDFFFWLPSVQATLDVIPPEFRNHAYGPNANHTLPVPGGQGNVTDLPADQGPANLERVFFDYHLRGIGKPLPRVTVVKGDDSLVAGFTVVSPTPITKAEVYWSTTAPEWDKRKWLALPATKLDRDTYEAKLPSEAAAGGHWFASVSDDRPVTVSSDLYQRGRLAPAGAKALVDLPYVENGHERQKLNLFLPEKKSDTPLPVIVVIHGGGWIAGDRGGAREGAAMLARGYAVAGISYRLSSDATFPAQIEDCKAAIRWLRAHAGEYNLDPDRFAAVGGSAGGHLAALLGTSGGVNQFNVGENLDQSSRVQAVVMYAGATDLVKLIETKEGNGPPSPRVKLIGGPLPEKQAVAEQASSVTHVTNEAPPFLIIHGDQDNIVPLDQSERLFEALKNAGTNVRLHTVHGAGHLDLHQRDIVTMQNQFLEQTLMGKHDPNAKPVAIQTESTLMIPTSKAAGQESSGANRR